MTINDGMSLPLELQGNVERYAVYRCYSDGGELLYVGESGELGKRLGSHAQKVWFTQVRGITLEWYADELDALNAERRAIHVEHPRYNVQHRNSVSIQKPAPVRRKRRAKSRKGAPIRSAEESRALALAILDAEPGISGAELGERVGKSKRWGQLLKSGLAPTAAPTDIVDEKGSADE